MAHIEIPTTQQVRIEYQLARFSERLLAFLLDLFFLVGVYLLVLFTLISLTKGEFRNELGGTIFFIVLPIFGLILYFYLAEWLMNGQSFGKRLIGLKVVRLDGREASPADFLLRSLAHLIDTVLCGGILGSILISSTPRHQRIGDMAAHTTVIRIAPSKEVRLKDILGIHSLDNYEVHYPAVQQLTESDMLLIKEAVEQFRRFPTAGHTAALEELMAVLNQRVQLQAQDQEPVAFLETLIRDYIVLTR